MVLLKNSGNIIKEEAEALVNTVNCVGIMGKGVALQFKTAYPSNYTFYKKECDFGHVKIGKVLVYETNTLINPKLIINFPTKIHWKEKSSIEFIEKGLHDLAKVITSYSIRSIAIPPLGCGNGGLDWAKVKPLILEYLSNIKDLNLIIFEPNSNFESQALIHKTKQELTFVRASLILLLDSYQRSLDYEITQLVIQKLLYFLQLTGIDLKLKFVKAPYGPFANNVNYLLLEMDGKYIMGFNDRTLSSPLTLTDNALSEASNFLKENIELLQMIEKVKELIDGFESPYGLELLSTVHWSMVDKKTNDEKVITDYIQEWNPRKKELFKPNHIQKAIQHLEEKGFLYSLV